MKIARINHIGMAQIADALGQFHKLGRDHFTQAMLAAWAEAAENNFDGGGCYFEIPTFNSNLGCPVTVEIMADGYDLETVEE